MAPKGRGSGSNAVVTWVAVGVVVGVMVALYRSSIQACNNGQGVAQPQPICSPCEPCQPCQAMLSDLKQEVYDGDDSRLQSLVKELQGASALIKNLRAEVANQESTIQMLQKAASEAAPSDRHVPWVASEERDANSEDPGLAALLRQIAVNGEVLAAVSNMALAGDGGMLNTFVESVKDAGIPNAMIVAIDEKTESQVKKWKLPVHRMQIELQGAQKKLGLSNHGVSGMKFRILKRFLNLGYAVLLSDVDIVFLQNPFHHLHRDCDVESMSDGWDNATAYGFNDVYDDPSMGWARFAHSMRQVVFNSGLFYLRPTQATMDFMDMIIDRLERESAWDQAVFNEEAAFPASPVHASPHVRRRTMDYMKFMNSKVLFRTVRHSPHMESHVPVSVHVNYHNDKHQRMKAIIQRYVKMDKSALNNFPDGSHW